MSSSIDMPAVDPRLARAAALAVAAHMALLFWAQDALLPEPSSGRGAAPVLHVRQVAAAAVPSEPAADANAAVAPATPAAANPQQQVPPEPPRPPVAVPPAPLADAQVSAAAQPAEYLPRSRLTVPPRPLAEVKVPFPDDVKGHVDLKVRIALFIDAQGVVQRVRLDSDSVPAAFARTIQDTFLAARFSPGEVQGAPTASLIRLEVEFGTGPPR